MRGPDNTKGQGYRFGAFKGVYTPSMLTILGVIMYLRFGWVLGNLGLTLTIVVVLISVSIILLTALSLSSLATNMKVGGGGAYYIISRSLGIEMGAAVGIPLFLAQALGISFYSLGFAESVSISFPFIPETPCALVTLVALAALAYKSADLALKAQYFILGTIFLSLVSFFLGAPSAPAAGAAVGAAVGAAPAALPFWAVFAVFFPAVTGIEAGLSMSGDLDDPAKALPRGTIAAVLTALGIYIAIPIVISRRVSDDSVLLTNTLIMKDLAFFPPLLLLGIWGASLSSGMGALLGAPRTLQALAKDGVLPRVIGRGFGKGGDPRIAVVITFGVALLGILSGGLNIIAPVLSIFFLTSYGLLNVSAGFETLIGSPSWRPTFKTPWYLSVLGAFGCFAVMFMVNPGATFIAAAFSILVYILMQRRSLNARWGDMRYGILMLAARHAIYRLSEMTPDERTWRPNILVLSGPPTSRWYLIELADAISHGKGFLTVAAVVPESISEPERIDSMRKTIIEYLKKRSIPALVTLEIAPDALVGAQELVRTYGFGPIMPNTVLIGETEKKENFAEFARLVSMVRKGRKNLIIVREGRGVTRFRGERRIDCWWGRKRNNASLLLALSYLLSTSPEWEGAEIHLKTIVEDEDEAGGARAGLEALVERGRIDAGIDVIRRKGEDPFETIREASAGADIVFLGMREPAPDETIEDYARYYSDLLSKTSGLPPAAIVLAAEEIEFQRIFE